MVSNGPAGDVDPLFQSILDELFKIRGRESLFWSYLDFISLSCGYPGYQRFSRVRREFSVLAEGRHIFGRRPRKPRLKSLWHPGYMRGDVTACSLMMAINRFMLCKNSSVQLFNSDSSYDISKTSETFFFCPVLDKISVFSTIRGAQMFVNLLTWRRCERNRTGTPIDDGKTRGKD